MPMLVSALVNQMTNLLRFIGPPHVPHLPPMCSQFLPQILAGLFQMDRLARLANAVGFQRRRRAALGFCSRRENDSFELPSEFFGECAHKLFIRNSHQVGGLWKVPAPS